MFRSRPKTRCRSRYETKREKRWQGPQPGDVGFFKLGLLASPQSYNDGSKQISVRYDYCSFNSGRIVFVKILCNYDL